MSKKQLKALEVVLDYLYEEEKHYYEADEKSRRKHIFNHIRVLKAFLKKCE